MREARAAYRVIPGRLLTSVAAGPWIRLYSFQSLRVLNAQLQAVLSLQSYATSRGGSGRRRARSADATRGRGDAAELRHGLLDVLLAAARAVSARLPAVRRATAQEARARATRVSPTLRRGSGAYQRQPPAFQIANAVARGGALLALEAGDRAAEHRRRPDEAALARRRMAHGRVAGAEAPGPLPRARDGRRLGREPLVVRCAADRARDRAGSRDRRPQDGGVDEGDRHRLCSRRGTRRSVAGRSAPDSSAFGSPGSASRGLRARRRPTRASSRRCSACPPVSAAWSS